MPETDDASGEVTLNLNGVALSSSENSVIYCASADKLEISAKKGTTNTLTDLRSVQEADDDTQGGGVLYSKVDTKLKGNGTLEVTGTYNNGIHVAKDLEIQKLTLKSTAINNAIKGNDSITINSGDITAISSGGDGLKTEDSDLSSKGNQRGDINILGGTVNIYSACDGIQAAHDFYLGELDSESAGPTVSIYTNKYSPYTNESDISANSESTLYIRSKTNYSSYRFAGYFYNNPGEEGVWSDASYLKAVTSQGGRSTYYYYEMDLPSSYSSFTLYAFNSNSSTNSTTNYVAKSSGNTLNADRDLATFSISGSSISISGWSTYSASSSQQGGFPDGGGFPGGSEGNSDKADVSAKGIKTQNDCYIRSGNLSIQANDDGIHANYGEALDNGETSTGDVYLQGGTTQIACSDDGVHADRYLYVQGGSATVTSSYETFEGNQIYVQGGTAVAYASNDAINAGNGSNSAGLTPLIQVSGGHLFAAVPTSGDTDGVDSNGNYVQTGGEVVVAGPANAGGAAAVDTDGSVSIQGGTFIVFGSFEKNPSYSGSVTASGLYGYYGSRAYTVTFTGGSVVTETLPSYTYTNCLCYSVLGTVASCA